MRYHKEVYFSNKHKEDIISFTFKLNNKDWLYTNHCLDNLKLRILDLKQLLYYIKNQLKLNSDDIFEFYTDDKDNILKACYRISYNHIYDVILVIGHNKEIITIYINEKSDKHETLKKYLYTTI